MTWFPEAANDSVTPPRERISLVGEISEAETLEVRGRESAPAQEEEGSYLGFWILVIGIGLVVFI